MVGIESFLSIILISFLLGSIPNGIIIGKLFYHIDIREQGSGNIGTTNAIRAMGKKGGYAVFLLDFAKGVASGLIALWIFTSFSDAVSMQTLQFTQAECLCAAFFGCVLGHVFSPWLGFHGGKGIAVSVGCLFVTFGPVGALLELAAFIVVVAATKYVSAGSITAAVVCPPLSLFLFWGDWLACGLCCAVAAVVIWAHRENIGRLSQGTESKIGKKKAEDGGTR